MSDTTAKKPKEKKEKDPINLFYMIRKTYPMWFKTNPVYATVHVIISIIHGASHGVQVLATQLFFDAVYDTFLGKKELNHAIMYLLLYAGVTFASQILNAVHNFMTEQHWSKCRGIQNVEIARKSCLINPVEYENPKRLDDINKAKNGVDSACGFILTTMTIFAFYLPYFGFMGFYLNNLKPTLILALLLVFIPVIISQLLRSNVFSKLEDKVAPFRREYDAYKDDACGRGKYKETRILGAFSYFKSLFTESIASLSKAEWKAHKRSVLIDTLFITLQLLGYGGILFLLVTYLLAGEISVGAFAAVFSSIGLMFAIMNEVIQRHIGTVANNFGQIRNFLRFLEIPERTGGEAFGKRSDIVVSGANFRYPNAEKDSLTGINLTIKSGETIAIVGENGAGKTTLVRLITGLYNPTEGKVTINGRDISGVNYRALFEGTSGIFQKYQRYSLTLARNYH
ncbi:hypothetical protein FACS1894219_11350 [Clostridia bacterium]|nr:hypothetical protein FACS1894219_11350 [Clostridia bacterium]